ncbi:MAG TPA: O-antigen ligase family protein [Geminicoccaceae bacterium]|nr:O-antigen ligase family protein [Geminicoccaceae bacterium]
MTAQALSHDLRPVFDRSLERLLCVLVVVGAVKLPLGIPLYLNSALLLLGLFSLVVLQALPRLFLWMVGLIGLGAVAALQLGIVANAGPRLAQLFLILLATALIARLDPALLARYLALLLPVILLVMVVEPLLPDPLWEARKLFGVDILRQGGLLGEPNYNAMLCGVVAMILAEHWPRSLAIPPLLAALPSLSRGLLAAIVAWLCAKAVGRRVVWLAPIAVLILCAQPLIVLAIDQSTSRSTQNELNRLSSNRYMIWVAHAEAGASTPLGVGYFNGKAAITRFAGLPPTHAGRQAHSVFLQAFGEFGWLGYLTFVGFIVHLSLVVARHAAAQLPLLLFIMTGYAFLNGLSDWAFWVGLGYLLAQARVGAEHAARAGQAHADS